MRLAAAAFVFLVAAVAQAAEPQTQDNGGCAMPLPAQVSRVFPAGPPASIDLFAVAPEKMLGWTRGTRPKDDIFVPTAAAALPELSGPEWMSMRRSIASPRSRARAWTGDENVSRREC